MNKRKGILFIIENLPLPWDRRVLLEASALSEKSIPVYAICPKGKNSQLLARERLPEGIDVFRYPNPPETSGFFSYFIEFCYCFAVTFCLSLWIYIRYGFQVIHTANPPDTFFLLALFFRPFGVKFIYDQHDLCPELYCSRFKKKKNGLILRVLYSLEKFSYRTAHKVIVTNESYRQTALKRGKISEDNIHIVRSAPSDRMLKSRTPKPQLKHGAKYLIFYLGVMGPQDGVDILIDAYSKLLSRKDLQRSDYLLVLGGDGDERSNLETQTRKYGIHDRTIFKGFITGNELLDYLATADIGVSPDPPTPFNCKSTMNKVMEYMAFGVPVIAFKLHETEVTLGNAGCIIQSATSDSLAESIIKLLENDAQRKEMGRIGKKRVNEKFKWEFSKRELLNSYKNLIEIPIDSN